MIEYIKLFWEDAPEGEPIASLTGQPVTFTGRGRLMERPQCVYETLYGIH